MGRAPDLQATRRSLPSGTVTFLLTDIEASTSHWQRHPDAMRVALARHDSLITRGVEEYHGTVLTERGEGDSVFAVFARASDALGAANTIQRALHQEPWPEGCTIRVRMAINTGEADEDYRGTVVNRCARLRSLARGGQVLISGSVRELALDHLPRGTRLKDAGRHQLRGLDRPDRVYQLVDPELAAAAPRSATWFYRWRLAIAAGAALGLLAGGVVVLALPNNPVHAGPVITTVLGTGPQGYSVDGTPPSSALITRPFSVTADSRGNMYFTDGDRVREVTADGTLITVAGTGTFGFSGDGHAATLAQLGLPSQSGPSPVGTAVQLAVDPAGDLFIPDVSSQRVREVTPEGVISTVAGSGLAGYAGDGGPARRAQLNSPRAVVIDKSGNLFIADTENNVIRRVDVATGLITTFAGSTDATSLGDKGLATDAGLNAPQGLAFDNLGNLYIADAGNDRVRRIDTSGVISTVAGNGVPGYFGDGGPATKAELNIPVAVAVSSAGVLFIADSENNRVRKVDLDGRITTVAGTGSRGDAGDGRAATAAQLALPLGVAVDRSGALLIADSFNNRIRRVQ